MQHKTYIHRFVQFEYNGKLNIRLPHSFAYLKKQLNNGVLSWRLNRATWLSINQLKKILNERLDIKRY